MNSGKINIMKNKLTIIVALIFGGIFFNSCESIEINQLEFTDSSFKEVRMYLKEIKKDHTTRKDLTVSSTIDKEAKKVTVLVKYDADITKLYGIATLERGAKVNPVGNAPRFGTIGDYSKPQTYSVKTPNRGASEWKVIVVLADPPPPVVGPTGFELVRKDGTSKHIGMSMLPSSRDIEDLGNTRLGLAYNGTDQYSSVEDNDIKFRGTSDFSISFWVKTTATNSDPSIIGDKDWGSGSNPGFIFAFTKGTYKLNVGGGGRIDINGNKINDGKWHLVAATFDRDGNATLYEDGVAIGSADISALTNMDSGLPINIAQDGTGKYGKWFEGSIANVKIFDYVLKPNQVFELLTTGVSLRSSSGQNKHLEVTQHGETKPVDFTGGKFGFTYDDSATQFSTVSDNNALDFRHEGDFSIACWVKTTSTLSDPAILSDKNWGGGGNKGFILSFIGEKWKMNAGDGSNRIDITGKKINDGKWHLLVATFDRDGDATIYQDGVAVGNTSMTEIGNMNSTFPINIAQDGTGSYGKWFEGSVAKTLIFDYALTSSEVMTLFKE